MYDVWEWWPNKWFDWLILFILLAIGVCCVQVRCWEVCGWPAAGWCGLGPLLPHSRGNTPAHHQLRQSPLLPLLYNKLAWAKQYLIIVDNTTENWTAMAEKPNSDWRLNIGCKNMKNCSVFALILILIFYIYHYDVLPSQHVVQYT